MHPPHLYANMHTHTHTHTTLCDLCCFRSEMTAELERLVEQQQRLQQILASKVRLGGGAVTPA